MGRLQSFILGLIVGGALVCVALKYHVVRANDGVHLIPKTAPNFQEMYVDIRRFSLDDWNRHRTLAAALVKAGKTNLLNDGAGASFRDAVDGALGSFSSSPSP